MNHQASAGIFERARLLKENETHAEGILWEKLKGKQLDGYKFRRQHPIGRYILDFYCHGGKIGIEIDGAYHQDKLQQWMDNDRTQFLEELELQIIRFTNEEVLDQIEMVLEKIKETVNIRA